MVIMVAVLALFLSLLLEHVLQALEVFPVTTLVHQAGLECFRAAADTTLDKSTPAVESGSHQN